MFLQDKETGELVKILKPEELFNPAHNKIIGKIQGGQEEQGSTEFAKENLIFPSGEPLPRCWIDADYRLKSPPQ